MTCVDFQTRLSAYLDDELNRWTHWRVAGHLRTCTECQSQLRQLREADAGLRELAATAPVPDFLVGAVMRRLPAMPPIPAPRPRLSWRVGFALAGAQAAALVGVWWWGFHSGAGTSRPASAPPGLAGGRSGNPERVDAQPAGGLSPVMLPLTGGPAAGVAPILIGGHPRAGEPVSDGNRPAGGPIFTGSEPWSNGPVAPVTFEFREKR